MFADYCEEERKPGAKKHTRKTSFQWKDQDSFAKMVNSGLEEIYKSLYPTKTDKLTSYYVRHSVASILRSQRVSVSDVAVILGHTEPDHAVTGTYINEEYEPYDVIMRKLIDLLYEKKEVVLDYCI